MVTLYMFLKDQSIIYMEQSISGIWTGNSKITFDEGYRMTHQSSKQKKHHPQKQTNISRQPVTVLPPERIIPPKIGRGPLILVSILLLLILAGVWLEHRMVGDLFIALAGGRDIISGHLGTPDNWSFTAGNRIWINQNWGTHLIFYLFFQIFGFNGLLVLKAILIFSCAFFLILAIRERGIPVVVGMLVTAVVIFSSYGYIDLRPNLITLVLAPLLLWLLYRTKQQPRPRARATIWPATCLIIIWANLHGGFIYGLEMMGLWVGCLIFPAILKKGLSAGLREHWQLAAGFGAALLMSGLLSPFGLTNLTHPLLIATDKAWQLTFEWLPIWNNRDQFGNIREFLFLISFTIALLIIEGVSSRFRFSKTKRSKPDRPHDDQRLIAFEVLLAVLTASMAVFSRRFIPLSLFTLAPILAARIWWLIKVTRWPWVIIGLGCMIFITSSGSHLLKNFRFYSLKLRFQNETFFEKMHHIRYFPAAITKFINRNHLAGNVFCDWPWEGYLRYYCPQLKFFIGGRAQQVYQEKTLRIFHEIFDENADLQTLLPQNGINLMILSNKENNFTLILNLLHTENWVIIFTDGQTFLLADTAAPSNRQMMQLVEQQQLIYPERFSALLSQAALLYHASIPGDQLQYVEDLKAALAIHPSRLGFPFLAIPLFNNPDQPVVDATMHLLEAELNKFQNQTLQQPGLEEILQYKFEAAKVLIEYYKTLGLTTKVDYFTRVRQEAESGLEELYQ